MINVMIDFSTLPRRNKPMPGRERQQDPLHTDACIWSPGIVICKLDASGNPRIDPEGWATVDVISCAAPNLRERTGNIHNPETAVPVHLTAARAVRPASETRKAHPAHRRVETGGRPHPRRVRLRRVRQRSVGGGQSIQGCAGRIRTVFQLCRVRGVLPARRDPQL